MVLRKIVVYIKDRIGDARSFEITKWNLSVIILEGVERMTFFFHKTYIFSKYMTNT